MSPGLAAEVELQLPAAQRARSDLIGNFGMHPHSSRPSGFIVQVSLRPDALAERKDSALRQLDVTTSLIVGNNLPLLMEQSLGSRDANPVRLSACLHVLARSDTLAEPEIINVAKRTSIPVGAGYPQRLILVTSVLLLADA